MDKTASDIKQLQTAIDQLISSRVITIPELEKQLGIADLGEELRQLRMEFLIRLLQAFGLDPWQFMAEVFQSTPSYPYTRLKGISLLYSAS